MLAPPALGALAAGGRSPEAEPPALSLAKEKPVTLTHLRRQRQRLQRSARQAGACMGNSRCAALVGGGASQPHATLVVH